MSATKIVGAVWGAFGHVEIDEGDQGAVGRGVDGVDHEGVFGGYPPVAIVVVRVVVRQGVMVEVVRKEAVVAPGVPEQRTTVLLRRITYECEGEA